MDKIKKSEDNVLPAFDKIRSTLETARETYSAHKSLAKSIDLPSNKMKDYYNKIDISKVYLVAPVLDPRIKLRYFELNWEKNALLALRKNWIKICRNLPLQ